MKREAVGHTKIKRLCRRMDLALWQAVGLLESLWLLTGREAPRGDIGKLSDEDIALGLDYRGDEAAMIEALVAAGWIDRDPVERLVIHDWADHADDAVHMRLARAGQFFAGGRAPKLTRLTGQERDAAHKFYSSAQAVHTPCARNKGAGALPVPVPVPVPVPTSNTSSSNCDEGSLFPESPLKAQQTQWFEVFWAAYWLKRGKKDAGKAFRKAAKTQATWELVHAAEVKQRPAMMLREPDKRPHGATWLNGERWKDEDDPVPGAEQDDYPELPA